MVGFFPFLNDLKFNSVFLDYFVNVLKVLSREIFCGLLFDKVEIA